ncbi:hypothetical protein [Stigmatella hybrida]|uniref:hypothetical protein n=1 Tax=Stigmatella hybrida TaxID=394097 RepID=UPI001CDAAE96|nr:hypothetical protein [Stigmatella hybrida]
MLALEEKCQGARFFFGVSGHELPSLFAEVVEALGSLALLKVGVIRHRLDVVLPSHC